MAKVISFLLRLWTDCFLFNLLMVYNFRTWFYGEEIYGAKAVIIEGWGVSI